MLSLRPYSSDDKAQWDQIIDLADNAHFMFKRDYMDYHADRFDDCSFIIEREGKTVGVIPANKVNTSWYSHQGLTFGGVLLNPKYNRTSRYIEIFDALFATLKDQGFTHSTYKFLPHIYHKAPSEADMFALQHYDVTSLSREVTSSVDLRDTPAPSQLRKRSLKKAKNLGLIVEESNDFSAYWQVLSKRLEDKYSRKPLHTLEEIELLHARFPKNIRLFTVSHPEEGICAGTVMFETATVAHAQYIASASTGQECGALDMLFLGLIDQYKSDGKRYFDFGISTEDKGRNLNEPLAQFKEGFGGRPVIHYTASIEV